MGFTFDWCHGQLNGLQNGTIERIGNVTNATLAQSGWIWEGNIAGLMTNHRRDDITAITYKGCVEMCGDKTKFNDVYKAFNIAATWIFPMAILFTLPYESLHFDEIKGTVTALCHWLGSPQTAMTATIFNFDQIRISATIAKIEHQDDMGQSWDNAYYVLSCMNQYILPMQPSLDPRCPLASRETVDTSFVETLIYGLFRPLRQGPNSPAWKAENKDVEYTRQLLSALATQLRDKRRRGVIPTIFSLGTFLVAFIFSVVLAFGEVGKHVNVTPLTIGLLYSWLPLLVICTIVDRNPVSSDRTAELMSRWLHNVHAVRTWKLEQPRRDVSEINWWSGPDPVSRNFLVGKFIGQGRTMDYSGLGHAVVQTVKKPHNIGSDENLKEYDRLSAKVIRKLKGRRPGRWWFSAVSAFILVWIQISMACVVAILSPTVGIGCWSGSILLFGALTSFSWVVTIFQKSPGKKLQLVCTFVNFLALVWLMSFTGLVLAGALNNCYCKTTWMFYPLSGGYMLFADFESIREQFNVVVPWALACSVGLAFSMVVLFTAIFWWMRCDNLWSTNERTQAYRTLEGVKANMDWLR